MRRRDLLAVSLCLFAGRAALAAPRSVLDRSTGATILLSDAPWTLALDQPHLAAHARDYIALYAAEINIAGRRRQHLAAFFWSTVLGRSDFAGPAPEITLRADDRVLRLKPAAATPRDTRHQPLAAGTTGPRRPARHLRRGRRAAATARSRRRGAGPAGNRSDAAAGSLVRGVARRPQGVRGIRRGGVRFTLISRVATG